MSGTKVTTDPESYEKPIEEKPGPTTSDSLAAESDKQGGKFSENKGSTPYDVKSDSSTFANTDTSGATTLDPARDAEARGDKADDQKDDSEKGPGGLKYTEAVGGQGDFPGTHSLDGGYAGGSSKAKSELQTKQSSSTQKDQSDSTEESSNTSGRSIHVDEAPGYVKGDVTQQPLNPKPKGKNLTEGGFDSDAPNASFNTDIGSEEDPGRLAEHKYQKREAIGSNDAGMSSPGNTAGGIYDNLKDERA